jgi:hypothetical protein
LRRFPFFCKKNCRKEKFHKKISSFGKNSYRKKIFSYSRKVPEVSTIRRNCRKNIKKQFHENISSYPKKKCRKKKCQKMIASSRKKNITPPKLLGGK